MLVDTKDYYATGREKGHERRKKGYRKLAKKYHPDVAGNTKENVDKFKEIFGSV